MKQLRKILVETREQVKNECTGECVIMKLIKSEETIDFQYDSEEEKNNHIEEMKIKGYIADDTYTNAVFSWTASFRKETDLKNK